MGYWTYYLIWLLLAYGLRHPALLLGAVLFFVLRRFIPDPWVWIRTMGRIRAAEAQIAANPANVKARRDLARVYLERRRAAKARKLLDEALARDPDEPELLYLSGVARLETGDPQGALQPIVRAVERSPNLLFGEPYRAAARALGKLRRFEEQADALERYLACNSSSVEGHVRLAEARAKLGDRDGAREALRNGLATWSQVPGYQRRKQLGWWLRAQLARLWI